MPIRNSFEFFGRKPESPDSDLARLASGGLCQSRKGRIGQIPANAVPEDQRSAFDDSVVTELPYARKAAQLREAVARDLCSVCHLSELCLNYVQSEGIQDVPVLVMAALRDRGRTISMSGHPSLGPPDEYLDNVISVDFGKK